MSDGAAPKRRGRPPKAREQEPQSVIQDAEAIPDPKGRVDTRAGSGLGAERPDRLVADDSDQGAGRVHRSKVGLSVHERHGLIEEALYTHEMQLEHVRFDTRNRRWTFRPESRQSRASLLIVLKRGTDEREAMIDNARFGADNVREDVEAAIDLLDEALP